MIRGLFLCAKARLRDFTHCAPNSAKLARPGATRRIEAGKDALFYSDLAA
jgi:hypothetical protein